jgi:hypothetical protein
MLIARRRVNSAVIPLIPNCEKATLNLRSYPIWNLLGFCDLDSCPGYELLRLSLYYYPRLSVDALDILVWRFVL